MWFAFAELAADQKNGALAMPSQKKNGETDASFSG